MKPGDKSQHLDDEPVAPVLKPRVGDHWESPSGLGFNIKEVTKEAVTVDVDRVVHRNGRRVTEVRSRVVLITGWASFARPYKRVK